MNDVALGSRRNAGPFPREVSRVLMLRFDRPDAMRDLQRFPSSHQHGRAYFQWGDAGYFVRGHNGRNAFQTRAPGCAFAHGFLLGRDVESLFRRRRRDARYRRRRRRSEVVDEFRRRYNDAVGRRLPPCREAADGYRRCHRARSLRRNTPQLGTEHLKSRSCRNAVPLSALQRTSLRPTGAAGDVGGAYSS